MDNPKPQPKEYAEGPEAAKRFDALVRQVIAVPHNEIVKRHKEWEKERQRHRRKCQRNLANYSNSHTCMVEFTPEKIFVKFSPFMVQKNAGYLRRTRPSGHSSV